MGSRKQCRGAKNDCRIDWKGVWEAGEDRTRRKLGKGRSKIGQGMSEAGERGWVRLGEIGNSAGKRRMIAE